MTAQERVMLRLLFVPLMSGVIGVEVIGSCLLIFYLAWRLEGGEETREMGDGRVS